MTKHATIPMESPGINVAVVKEYGGSWRFLLLQRAEKETYPGFWGLLTGGREGEETVPELAVREMAEETGLRPDSLWASEYCLQFYEPTVDRVWILPVVVAVVSAVADVRLSKENRAFRWLLPKEAVEIVCWKNLKTVIADLAEELQNFPSPNWVELPVK